MLRNLSASSIASFSSYENQLIRNDSTNDLTNDDETPTRVIIETIANNSTASSSVSVGTAAVNTKSRDLKEYENQSTVSLILESNQSHHNHHNFKHESVSNKKSFLFKTGLKSINSSSHHSVELTTAKEPEELIEKKLKSINSSSSNISKASIKSKASVNKISKSSIKTTSNNKNCSTTTITSNHQGN